MAIFSSLGSNLCTEKDTPGSFTGMVHFSGMVMDMHAPCQVHQDGRSRLELTHNHAVFNQMRRGSTMLFLVRIPKNVMEAVEDEATRGIGGGQVRCTI